MSALYMFPPSEEPAEDRDLLAGEYALGVLDPGEAAAVRLRAEADPVLRAAIASWQERLVAMTAMLPRYDVPEGLWPRLAAEIGAPATPAPVIEAPVIEAPVMAPPPEPTPLILPPPPEPPLAPVVFDEPAPIPPAPVMTLPPPVPRPEPQVQVQTLRADPPPVESVAPPREAPAPRPAWPSMTLLHRIGPWQAATAIALGLAVSLAVLLLLPRGDQPRSIAAIGPVSAPAPLFLAECDASGRLRVTPLATIAVPGGRDLELWTLPPGAGNAQRPTSLGVLPANGRVVALGATPPEGTQLLVSMEPRGGSPSGQITGPVLYGGVLANH